MDAPETDFDVKLQKVSSDLLADLDKALTTALRKPIANGGTRVRLFVRARETFKSTTEVLDMFQELPQLLDPHLSRWIPLLAESFLEYIQVRHRVKKAPGKSSLLVPADYAICRILYAFCKVRGEKVVIRFLNVETKYLELLLSALEESEEKSDQGSKPAWEWEQRYVVLLWLSHLLLAPFDLATISTLDMEAHKNAPILGFEWPGELPGITMRALPLAVKYLSVPGKEKDAAKALLVRIAMRRDMQKQGVLDALVRWAMSSLRPRKDCPPASIHHYLGVLSFLAGVLRSAAETSDLDPHLASIFHCVYDITLGANEVSRGIVKLAIVRKTILKVMRSVTVAFLRQPLQILAHRELVETAIGYFLDSTSDNDTPVRLAASKALSIITLKLDPSMASQVVEAVLESLNRNVLWGKTADERPVRDLSAVNNLEWHGLVLTLSHLLYRRSPPADQLSDIIHALRLGLAFEQRSTSGGSIGANVRDAACFGIWALARRYNTKELLAVPTTAMLKGRTHSASCSILQVLATDLVVTASFDPAGNIRRGASAALQELIGRHPDTVDRGIEVVQTVDYHAVARRSRAIDEVATKAAELSTQYGEALIDAVVDWRGIGDVDAQSRRAAAAGFGKLCAQMALHDGQPGAGFTPHVQMIARRLGSLVKRQVEERHGLLLCFAALLEKMTQSALDGLIPCEMSHSLCESITSAVSDILDDYRQTNYRKPELIAEGTSRLLTCVLPIIELPGLGQDVVRSLTLGLNSSSIAHLRDLSLVSGQIAGKLSSRHITKLLSLSRAAIPAWLGRSEPEVFEPAAAAAIMVMLFSSQQDSQQILQEWVTIVATKPASRTASTGQGYFHALAMAQMTAQKSEEHVGSTTASQAILERWARDNDTNTRMTILQSLTRSGLLQDEPLMFLDLLFSGLNDYTTNARGDVGSHVRVHALRAVRSLLAHSDSLLSRSELASNLATKVFPSILRLSAEKLDRVRPEAQAAVSLMMRESAGKAFVELTFSSKQYFRSLLDLVMSDALIDSLVGVGTEQKTMWMNDLMAGFVSSADTGNDDLVIASREALTDFCQACPKHPGLVCSSLVQNLRTYHGDDRVAVPTLEIIAFLHHVDLFQTTQGINLRQLCLATQRAGFKTGNVRKLTACVKVYGAIATMDAGSADEAIAEGVSEAKKRLGALMFHPWPRVRSAVVDEIWGVAGFGEAKAAAQDDDGGGGVKLTGVDWSMASREQISAATQVLGDAVRREGRAR